MVDAQSPPLAPAAAPDAAEAPAEPEPKPEPEPEPKVVGAPPPLLSGRPALHAKRLTAFVEAAWVPALEGRTEAYEALLADEFEGTLGGKGEPLDRGAWVAMLNKRTAALGSRVGPVRVRLEGASGRATLTVHQADSKPRCAARTVRFVVLWSEGRLSVLQERWDEHADACLGDSDLAGLAAFHEKTRRILDGVRPDEAAPAIPHVALVDHGFLLTSYSFEELQGPHGRWIRELMAKTEADYDHTELIGRVGLVTAETGERFVYERVADEWTLQAIRRPGRAGKEAAQK